MTAAGTTPEGRIVTPASPVDFPILADVWEASVRATHHFMSPERVAQLRPRVEREFLPGLHVVSVRDPAGRPIAFAGVAEQTLHMLFVHPASMRKGIGRALAQYSVEVFGVTDVSVNEQNPDALAFYERMGFRAVARSHVDTLGEPFPLLHLRRPLIDTRPASTP